MEAAVKRGLRPILAGRNRQKLQPLAAQHGLEVRTFDLNPASIQQNLSGVSVVFNATGKQALLPLAQGALSRKAHYLDLSGEYPEFQHLHNLHAQALKQGSMLMPGVGFGVVPTDTLALHLKNRLPDATHLTLAFETVGGVSAGTLDTVIQDLPHLGSQTVNSKLVPTPAALKERKIPLGGKNVSALTHPWRADVFTALISTGIPNIETLVVAPDDLSMLLKISSRARWIFGFRKVQHLLKSVAGKAGNPGAEQRQRGLTRVWGEVRTRDGQKATALMTGPEAYDYSALSSALIAEKILQGDFRPGFQTPASVYGPDLPLQIPGVKREDLS